jgi:arylamine N-acetyltransferase
VTASLWSLGPDIAPLQASLTRAVLERLGLAPPPPTPDGLARLYAAWRERLGMENLSKRLALAQAADPLDAARTPEETFAGFLADATSGTCWTTMEAFVALARALGFDARPRLGEMTEPGVANHGATVVVIGDTTLSVDQNLLWPEPLPLVPGETTRVSGPHYTAEASWDAERRVFRIRRYSPEREFRPTVLRQGEVHRRDYFPFWRRSLMSSYFNNGCFVNRMPGGVWRRLDTLRYHESAPGAGFREETLPGLDAAFVAERFGLPARLVGAVLALEHAS